MENLKIIIPTIKDKYKTALLVCLGSLYSAGVNPSQIVVIHGGCENQTIQKMGDYSVHVHIKENMYEYHGFIGADILIKEGVAKSDTHFLLLHDTCKVFGNFVTKLNEQWHRYNNIKTDVLWLARYGQFNICLFNHKAADIISKKLKTFGMQLAKDKGIGMETGVDEDSLKALGGFFQNTTPEQQEERGIVDVYNTGIHRQVVYIPTLDTEKYFVPVPLGNIHPNHP